MTEIITILEEEDFNIDARKLFIEPPDVKFFSDEDSAGEDDGGTVDNISKSQLGGYGEVVLVGGTRIFGDCENVKSSPLQQSSKKTTENETVAHKLTLPENDKFSSNKEPPFKEPTKVRNNAKNSNTVQNEIVILNHRLFVTWNRKMQI